MDSTGQVVSSKSPSMGRRKINHESMMARFPAGTLARIGKALRNGENKADFVRNAVIEELSRREAKGDD